MDVDAIVIGAGPGGLAVLHELGRRDVRAVALERAPELAPTWRGAYDRLRLNTVAWLSHLPGRRMPRSAGRWPSRDDVVAYLEDYARGLDVRLGVEVFGLDPDGDAWAVWTPDGPVRARQVIVATGYCGVPHVPEWPGRGEFGGEIVHASAYRNGAPYAGRPALVVGAGTSGAEIAADLADAGAAPVGIAIRTMPQVVVRQVAGVPNQLATVVLHRLPARLGDRLIAASARRALGDLRPLGLEPPADGAVTRSRRDGVNPIVDAGFVDGLRAGRIEVVPSVERLVRNGAVLTDGSEVAADVIVAATGYRPGLETLVGHLGLLDARGLPVVHGAATHPDAPGLRFVGFSNPISGNLREMRLDARRIARAVAADVAAPARVAVAA